MKNIPKILLVIFLVIFILQMITLIILLITPFVTQAFNPALDPTCWPKSLCEDPKTGNGRAEIDPACGGTETWVRCYPKNAPIPLQIKILGQENVTDVAAYIALFYKYTVGIGAILATVMILWGGIVYLTAGGAPEKIKSAKDYISNALIGLVLLYTSYLLLQTLNPDLVKLQMPRVYMIRPMTLGAQFCQDIEGGVEKTGNFTPATSAAPTGAETYNIAKGNTQCAKEYFWKNGGTQRCWGKKCPGMQNCAAKSQGAGYECVEGFPVVINFSGGAWATEARLYAVCKEGDDFYFRKIADTNVDVKPGLDQSTGTGAQNFTFKMTYDDFYKKLCPTEDLLGISIGLLIQENNGYDDWYMVGRPKDKPIRCTKSHGGPEESDASVCENSIQKNIPENINKDDLLSEHEFSAELGRFPLTYTLDRTNFPGRAGK